MTFIANPIYDSVFKYMMEDDRVAKIMLSALLQKEVIEVTMQQHEYTETSQSRISMLRLDFHAKVRNNDGSEQVILIELQKTWLVTETLRFRQYLGVQYLDKKNIPERNVNPQGYAYPIVSIYILGHKLGDLEEPVVYVRRKYLDYNSNPITNGVPDPFIESLTHDSIVVQIPYLKGRVRNHLERLLQVFDQEYCSKEDEHLLEVDESRFFQDEQLVVNRLIRAAATPNVRRAMEVEDQILSEIESRDTTIMMKDEEIERKNKDIEQKNKDIEQKNKDIEQKNKTIEQKNKDIEQKNQMIAQLLAQQGLSAKQIAEKLHIAEDKVIAYLSPQPTSNSNVH